jgi:hypothetical protein
MIPALEKYLARHLEPEGRAVGKLATTFGHAIAIPAYDEGDNVLRTLRSIPTGPLGEVLSILVVNAPADAPESVHDRSQQLIGQVRREYGAESVKGGPSHFDWFDHPRGALLCVDRTGPRSLPKGQGVGLARKIGCDIALQLYSQGKLRSAWIHTTDADVELPSTYFERVPLALDADAPAALLYPFWHQTESPPELADAMRRYELFLRYYVLGLAYAGSPYAFHTLGSILAVHCLAYAKVRGFPRRDAGEDFYLLNKLAKVGPILQLDGAPLMIRGRSSHRVPFGTGAALKRILASSAKGEPYRVYAPDVFPQLKISLAALQLFCADRGREDPIQCLKAAGQMHQGVDAQQLHCELMNLGYLSALRHAQRISRDTATMLRHLHSWFDAFRTLKFVHQLTRIFPKVELLEAIRTARFVGNGSAQLEDLQQLRLALVDLERSRPVQFGTGSQCTSTSSVSRPPPTKMVPDVGVAST